MAKNKTSHTWWPLFCYLSDERPRQNSYSLDGYDPEYLAAKSFSDQHLAAKIWIPNGWNQSSQRPSPCRVDTRTVIVFLSQCSIAKVQVLHLVATIKPQWSIASHQVPKSSVAKSPNIPRPQQPKHGRQLPWFCNYNGHQLRNKFQKS